MSQSIDRRSARTIFVLQFYVPRTRNVRTHTTNVGPNGVDVFEALIV